MPFPQVDCFHFIFFSKNCATKFSKKYNQIFTIILMANLSAFKRLSRRTQEKFARSFRARRERRERRGKAAASIEPDRILQRVAEKYRVDRERLVARGERGLHARNVAMWMIWETGNKSLREIGELFGGLDYAAVAQRIRRTRSSHDSIAARKLKATMLNV